VREACDGRRGGGRGLEVVLQRTSSCGSRAALGEGGCGLGVALIGRGTKPGGGAKSGQEV
jgi:hypothetical protein